MFFYMLWHHVKKLVHILEIIWKILSLAGISQYTLPQRTKRDFNILKSL